MTTVDYDVWITGTGLVCSLGLDCESTWRNVLREQDGIGPLRAIESPLAPNKGGGQAPDLPGSTVPDESREVAYLKMAVKEALGTAGVLKALPYSPARCGVVLGTTLHGMRNAGRFLRSGDICVLDSFLAGSTLFRALGEFGLEGFATTVCSACSSGLTSIALAVTLLRAGLLDLAISGGYDPISEYAYGGFNSMRLVTEGRIRPFACNRDGMKLGEGYGIVMLERAGDAVRRGAQPIARIAGFGEACDAHHLSKPHPQGLGAVSAMRQALESAGLAGGDIDLVAAHSTATPDNDAAEYAALSRVFAEKLGSIPVVAFKSRIGHTLGGAGAVELILSACALRDQVVPPCANVEPKDVEFEDLCLATGDPKRAPLRLSLNLSLGFGGSNACVVLEAMSRKSTRRHEVERRRDEGTKGRRDNEAWITGVGVVLPGAVGNEAFLSNLAQRDINPILSDTGDIGHDDLDHLLSARRIRRMSNYVKLTLAATAVAFRDARIDDIPSFGADCAGILATTHGSTAFSEQYYEQIVSKGIEAANPLLFAEGVPNAGSAHLSEMMSIKGLCQTVIGTRTAGLDALLLAFQRIRSGAWDRAVVAAGDEYGSLVNRVYAHFGLHRRQEVTKASRRTSGHEGAKGPGFVTGCGAVALILESEKSRRARGVAPRGRVQAATGAFTPSLASRRGIEAVGGMISALGSPGHVICSANGTWLTRVELMAVRVPHNGDDVAGRQAIVSSIYGHTGECFSANPLAGLAAALLTGRLPAWRAGWSGCARTARGDERPDAVAVIATDYTGAVSGARIGIGSG